MVETRTGGRAIADADVNAAATPNAPNVNVTVAGTGLDTFIPTIPQAQYADIKARN